MTASFPIPSHVVSNSHREPVRIRICAGRGPAHTGIPGWSRETPLVNPVRIVIGSYPSAAKSISQAGGGCWPLKVKRSFPQYAPFSGPFTGTGYAGRITCPNCILRALDQACKQARRVFTVLFRPSLSRFVPHGQNHGASNVEKIRNCIGAENELR